ncbi:hypothetical protein V5O48_013919 [Marasmius crinis-equi]|uniref:Carboxylic ester hydrolase n=1 Tax=Marasmius crinis-equi TaxID=585013 RepID=A0ABR3EYR7_9AGAR
MFALSLVSSFLLFSSVVAAPAAQSFPLPTGIGQGRLDWGKLWCQVPVLKNLGHCPRAPADGLQIATPIGPARGTFASGANRFSVKYASANRWAPSTVATTWQLPNGANDPATLPLACPQPNLSSSSYSEDCLSMVLYVPTYLNPNSKAPVMVWIHGGSFVVGSASDPSVDGANLAMTTGSIVAVIQYRLGALGFLEPQGQTNLGAKDVVSALQFLKANIAPFGGDASKVTLAGQSAGANMIRALLAAPSAQPLFRSAIIQSDPMGYGFLSTSVRQDLVDNFLGQISCSASDTSCLNSASLSSIVDATWSIQNSGQQINAAAGQGEPIRVVQDGSFITSPLDSTGSFPSVSKPLLISTVKNEAATTVYHAFGSALPNSAFEPVCAAIIGSDRASTIASSGVYPNPPLSNGSEDSRVELEVVGTDQMWKCASWTFARNWVQHGGKAFVGVYTRGATYPGNEAYSVCTQPGEVCHQDDIRIVFGNVPNPSTDQAALIAEVQGRYKAFLQNGNPNAGGLSQWSESSTTDVHALNLGGVGTIATASCDPSFWGGAVPFDYQIYNL